VSLRAGDGVEAVDLVEIDMIEGQSFQAGGDLIHDVSARESTALVLVPSVRAPWWR